MTRRRRAVLLSVLVGLAGAGGARADEITVFAAASLKTALDAVAADWQTASGHTATVAYGSSATLAHQIAAGAPADLYLSASTAWMDDLDARNLLRPGTRTDLLGNTLVLVAHGRADPVTIAPGFDLAGLLGDGRLAMGMVDSVPAGQYGKQALVSLGLWDAVAAQVAQTENVRAALALVAQGEAALGIVYGSDAIAGAGAVTVIATFPADSHAPIVYPAARLTDAPAAQDFLTHLSSDAADAIFAAQGFAILN